MENGLLEDIRALLIGKRARELRINLQKAESDADIEEIEIEGETHRVLTHEAGIRAAVKELQHNKTFIAELLKN
ncbi:MAG: hypothetical protein ACOH1V_01630 [Stenotrophomonas sp.]